MHMPSLLWKVMVCAEPDKGLSVQRRMKELEPPDDLREAYIDLRILPAIGLHDPGKGLRDPCGTSRLISISQPADGIDIALVQFRKVTGGGVDAPDQGDA